jgi:hygromycin-B 4-O-kinase
VPSALLEMALAKVSAGQIQSWWPMTGGKVHQVFGVKTAGLTAVVRLLGQGVGPPPGEAAAMDACRLRGLPVSRTLFAGVVPWGGQPFGVAVQELLPGIPLDQRLQSPRLYYQAGSLLARIHQVPVSGFGPLDGSLRGAMASAEDLILPLERYLMQGNRTPYDHLDIPTAKLMKAMKHLRGFRGGCAPVLLHGDFNATNLLASETGITGILDFEYAMGGDPIWDLARCSYSTHGEDWDALLGGYQDVGVLPEDAEILLQLYRLRISLEVGGFLLAARLEPHLRRLRHQLHRDLLLVSTL